jgi:segregation and condensation protein B
LNEKEIMAIIEAVLFVSGDPISLDDLAEVLEITDLELRCIVDKMINLYKYERRGIQIVQFEDKIQFCTHPEYGDYIQRLLHPVQKQSLSQAAMETLAIIAYRQPITRPEIEAIRGVKCDYTISLLLERGLIKAEGRKDGPGRPILYVTTEEFLKHFGISSIDELPELEEMDDDR